MLIDLLLDRRINADFSRQIGNNTDQPVGVGHQGNIAFAEALQCLDLATLAQPNLVVGRDRGTPELGIDLEDPLGDGTEVPRRGQMFRIRVGVRAGWRWQVFPPIESFEIAQSCHGALQMLAGSRPDQQIVGAHLIVQAVPVIAIAIEQHHPDAVEAAILAG